MILFCEFVRLSVVCVYAFELGYGRCDCARVCITAKLAPWNQSHLAHVSYHCEYHVHHRHHEYQHCNYHSSSQTRVPFRYDQGRDTLVTLTEDLMCIQSTVGQFGKLDPPSESKLSGRRLLGACWVGDGVLATATDEARLSVWSLAMMDNYVLEPPPSTKKLSLINVAYAEDGKLLAGVAVNGTVCMWRHNGGPFDSGAAQWIEQIPVAIDAAVTRVITGGAAKPIVAVQTEHGVEILREHVMKCAYGGQTSVLQTASNRAIIEHGLKTSQDLEVRALSPCPSQFFFSVARRSNSVYVL